jgi:hypothetical protein
MWNCITCPQSPRVITPHTQATRYTNTNINININININNNGYRASNLCYSRCNNNNNTSIPCNSRCNSQCNNRCKHLYRNKCNPRCSRLCSSQSNTRTTSRISNRPLVLLLAHHTFLNISYPFYISLSRSLRTFSLPLCRQAVSFCTNTPSGQTRCHDRPLRWPISHTSPYR